MRFLGSFLEKLGCPQELMGDSAKMNLVAAQDRARAHRRNGGNVPKVLLD